MHLSVVFATLFLLAGFASAQVCPPQYNLVPEREGRDHSKKCVCEKIIIHHDRHHEEVEVELTDPNHKCQVELKHGECHAVCPTHTPSGHKKRQQLILNDDGSISNCPLHMASCPIDSTMTMNMGYECISPKQDLDNCGGCVALGQGTACDKVSGVRETECNQGRCVNRSCLPGWVLDRTNTCVPHLKRR